MLKLYHGTSSVCSIKVRLGIAEKGLDFESHIISLQKGEQNTPEYLEINPFGVVPTLIHNGFKVYESSVILDYVDGLSDQNPLMPEDRIGQTISKMWLIRSIEIHSAINTMTFATGQRRRILTLETPEQVEESISRMPDPSAAAKRRDLMDNGVKSNHVLGDMFTLKRMFDDIQEALEKTEWLAANYYSLADVTLLAYVDRLERLGMAGLWMDRTPLVGKWLAAAQARSSYSIAIDPYVSANEATSLLEISSQDWPEIKCIWDKFTST